MDITWLHAVNSPDKLEEGHSSNIMMFEADVLMRNNQVYFSEGYFLGLVPVTAMIENHKRYCGNFRVTTPSPINCFFTGEHLGKKSS